MTIPFDLHLLVKSCQLYRFASIYCVSYLFVQMSIKIIVFFNSVPFPLVLIIMPLTVYHMTFNTISFSLSNAPFITQMNKLQFCCHRKKFSTKGWEPLLLFPPLSSLEAICGLDHLHYDWREESFEDIPRKHSPNPNAHIPYLLLLSPNPRHVVRVWY